MSELLVIAAVRAVRQLTRLQAVTDPNLQTAILEALREVEKVERDVQAEPGAYTEHTWPMFKHFCLAQAELLETTWREVNEFRDNHILRRN